MATRSRTLISLLVAVSLTASAPAALAHSTHQLYGPEVRPNPDAQVIAVPSASAPATIVRVSSPGAGFDWGDAGIGAIGGLAVSLVAVGGALAFSQRRGRPAESDLRT